MRNQLEARAELVKVLRSDEFQQGQNYLHYDDKYCCLGVATELAIRDGVQLEKEERDLDRGQLCPHVTFYRSRDDDTSIFDEHGLSASVVDYYGFENEFGEFGEYDPDFVRDSLANMNDNGKTFAEIADIIESEPKGLFCETGKQSA